MTVKFGVLQHDRDLVLQNNRPSFERRVPCPCLSTIHFWDRVPRPVTGRAGKWMRKGATVPLRFKRMTHASRMHALSLLGRGLAKADGKLANYFLVRIPMYVS